MYQRIVVATDGSAVSELALRHAVVLARGLASGLRILHVVENGWLGLGMELAIDTEAMSRTRRNAGERILENASAVAAAAGVAAETRLEELASPTDHVADVIALAAKEWPADLVVLGTHGRRNVERLLLGGVSERLARISPVPVLLVNPHAAEAR
jgi:nucleotide-binding universal stress UspA family protein